MFHGEKSFIALLLAAETSNREMFLKSLGLPFSQPIRYPLEKWEKLSFRKKMSLFHISMNVNADDVRCSTGSQNCSHSSVVCRKTKQWSPCQKQLDDRQGRSCLLQKESATNIDILQFCQLRRVLFLLISYLQYIACTNYSSWILGMHSDQGAALLLYLDIKFGVLFFSFMTFCM